MLEVQLEDKCGTPLYDFILKFFSSKSSPSSKRNSTGRQIVTFIIVFPSSLSAITISWRTQFFPLQLTVLSLLTLKTLLYNNLRNVSSIICTNKLHTNYFTFIKLEHLRNTKKIILWIWRWNIVVPLLIIQHYYFCALIDYQLKGKFTILLVSFFDTRIFDSAVSTFLDGWSFLKAIVEK